MLRFSDDTWRALPVPAGDRYAWDPGSTYVKRPPYFDGMPATAPITSPSGKRTAAG